LEIGGATCQGRLWRCATILWDLKTCSIDGPVKVVRSAEGGRAPVVVPLDKYAVVMEAHRVCRRVRATAEGERLPDTCPEHLANLCLPMRGEQNLKRLVGVSSAPLLDAGLRVCEGYDTETGLWCAGIPPIDIPDRPSLKDEPNRPCRWCAEPFGLSRSPMRRAGRIQPSGSTSWSTSARSATRALS